MDVNLIFKGLPGELKLEALPPSKKNPSSGPGALVQWMGGSAWVGNGLGIKTGDYSEVVCSCRMFSGNPSPQQIISAKGVVSPK